MSQAPRNSQFLIDLGENGAIKIDVLEDDTVWLTPPLIAELFQTTQQNISLHALSRIKEARRRF